MCTKTQTAHTHTCAYTPTHIPHTSSHKHTEHTHTSSLNAHMNTYTQHAHAHAHPRPHAHHTHTDTSFELPSYCPLSEPATFCSPHCHNTKKMWASLLQIHKKKTPAAAAAALKLLKIIFVADNGCNGITSVFSNENNYFLCVKSFSHTQTDATLEYFWPRKRAFFFK